MSESPSRTPRTTTAKNDELRYLASMDNRLAYVNGHLSAMEENIRYILWTSLGIYLFVWLIYLTFKYLSEKAVG